MNSESSREPLVLERDLRTLPADSIAQRRLRAGVDVSLVDYLDFLAQFPVPTREQLRAKRGPRGTPFSLAAKSG